MDGLPFFLEKNIIKEDIILGSFQKHYYFEIIKGEFGDITLNFKKGVELFMVQFNKEI